jgi:serine/threonine-protein kinase
MLAFAPFMALLGFRDVPLAIALLVLTLSSAALTIAVARRPASERQALYWIECALNVLFLIGLSRMGGPFILIPVATLVVCTELSVQNHVSRTGLGIAVVMLSVILPFLLEEIGLLPQSMRVLEEGVLFIPQLVEVGGRYALWLLLGGILFVMLGFLRFIAVLQQAKHEAQTRNALHAWHLRQLLPEDLEVTRRS